MNLQNLKFEKKDQIAYVTINRPDKLNALNQAVMGELREVFTQIKDDPEVRVALLTGAGEKAFVAGADINELNKNNPVEAKAYTASTKKLETTPQMFRLGWCQDYPDPQDWYTTVFDSKSTVSHTGWKNDQFDKLVRDADVQQDAKKRDDEYKQAGQILIDDAPVAFHYHDVSDFLVKPYLTGCKFTPLDYYTCQSTIMQAKIAPH